MVPAMAFMAWSLTLLRQRRLAIYNQADLTSGYRVELAVRALLQDGIARDGLVLGSADGWGASGDGNTRGVEAALKRKDRLVSVDGAGIGFNNVNSINTNNSSSSSRQREGGPRRGAHLTPAMDNKPWERTSAGSVQIDVSSATAALQDHRPDASDVASATITVTTSSGRQLHVRQGDYIAVDLEDVTHPALQAAEAVFSDAGKVAPPSPLLRLIHSHFLGRVRRNIHLERLQLKLADSQATGSLSWIDVKYGVWARRAEMAAVEAATGRSKMKVERRIRFENLLAQSREQAGMARNLLLEFWCGLAEKVPDLSRMQVIGSRINVAIRDATWTFEQLMSIASNNAAVMRAYADFLLEIANNPGRAQELLSDAEQVEEEASRARDMFRGTEVLFGAAAPDFALSSESVGFLRVSSDMHNLGTITHCNSAAMRMFGYARRELLGRPLDSLIPEPVGGVHNLILAQHLDDGKERVMGVSRTACTAPVTFSRCDLI